MYYKIEEKCLIRNLFDCYIFRWEWRVKFEYLFKVIFFIEKYFFILLGNVNFKLGY